MLTRLLTGIALPILASLGVAQTTWFVDASGTPPGTGTSDDPYTSLQYAIGRATTVAGDTVLVRPGTYFEHVDFLGKALAIGSTDGPATTILDGSHSGTVVTCENGEPRTTRLTGFTLQHGTPTHTDPVTGHLLGSGLYIENASPVVENCRFESLDRAEQGTGVFARYSNSQFIDCTFSNLTGDGNSKGLGAAFRDSNPRLVGCVFTNLVYAGEGAGVYLLHGVASFQQCVFVGCAASEGGAVYVGSSPAVAFEDCHFAGNYADVGGAIQALYATGNATVVGCTFLSCVAEYQGGGLAVRGALWRVVDSEFKKCDAPQGAGIFADGGQLEIEASRFVGNIASGAGFMTRGAGLCVQPSAKVIVRRTLFDQNAIVHPFVGSGQGAGVWGAAVLDRCTLTRNQAVRSAAAYGATLTNSIVWSNQPTGLSSTTTARYCDVEGGAPGVGNLNADPSFTDPANGEFTLQADSPCIDAGDPAARPDPDGTRADLGAFPFEPAP
ncbi:MAG: right-handed parallel beta-helix repeat-containing protein [Planctomycetes bacterium]|nr:right-handed parallel beta-helix repeat-containing protein [Planctomycetota bacterium]